MKKCKEDELCTGMGIVEDPLIHPHPKKQTKKPPKTPQKPKQLNKNYLHLFLSK